VAFCLIIFFGCSDDDNGVTPPPPKDTTAPAAITDLACIDITDQSVTLTWTATGDDGNSGTASTYSIRYAPTLIDSAGFATATQAAGAPAPKTAGSTETFEVTGLNSMTTYYFAIKAGDEAANWSAVSNSPDTTTDLPVLLQITTDPANDSWPAWSPDGSMIAFSSFRTGHQEIWVIPSTGGAATQITSFSSGANSFHNQSPTWSPAGDKIAFHSDSLSPGPPSKYDIWIVDYPPSGPPYRITTDDAHDEKFPEWSHDGTRIAFSSDANATFEEIFYVTLADSVVTQLTFDGFSNSAPTWSPDDLWIAFYTFRNSRHSIYKFPVSNPSAVEKVTTSTATERYPSWSPDGKYIAFYDDLSAPARNRYDVAIVDVLTKVRTLVSNANDDVHDQFPCWSPDSRRVAYAHLPLTAGGDIYSKKVQ
jgi:Tol biopolymer transport system component